MIDPIDWLQGQGVSRETLDRLALLERLTIEANEQQNLISRSTIEHFWTRHILDSAQLVPMAAEARPGAWIDLGAGAGFPGLVVALLVERPVVLIEMRRLRVEHLERMIAALNLGDRVRVIKSRVESVRLESPAAVISARAYAPLDRLIPSALHLADRHTLWLLPKGKSAVSELEAARGSWHGSFTIEPSLSDPDGGIIKASGLVPRRRG